MAHRDVVQVVVGHDGAVAIEAVVFDIGGVLEIVDDSVFPRTVAGTARADDRRVRGST